MGLDLTRLQQLIVERDSLTYGTLKIANIEKLSTRAKAILYHANATSGEAGELANIAKKICRDEMAPPHIQSEIEMSATKKGYLNACDMRTQQASKELADVVMHAALCAYALGIDLSQAVTDKFNEVTKDSGDKVKHLII